VRENGFSSPNAKAMEVAMSFLNNLKSKSVNKATKTGAKKGTSWMLTEAAHIDAVNEIVKLDREVDAINAKINVRKNILKGVAQEKWLSDYVRESGSPESPMKLLTPEGESLTYVVQDRSGQVKVSDDLREQLVVEIGSDAVDRLLYEETTFSFNRVALMNPQIEKAVSKALEALVEQVASIDPEISLLDVEQKVAYKKLDNLTEICGHDRGAISRFVELIGSALVRYLKV
jgi:hypothetical protein